MQLLATIFKIFRYHFILIAVCIFITFTFTSCKHSAAVRVDGLYQSQKNGDSYEYLRFFPGDSVIAVSSTDTPAQVAKWFNQSLNDVSKGTYTISGSYIKFSSIDSAGTVDYEGEIKGDHLSLKTHSRINDYRGSDEYQFIKN